MPRAKKTDKTSIDLREGVSVEIGEEVCVETKKDGKTFYLRGYIVADPKECVNKAHYNSILLRKASVRAMSISKKDVYKLDGRETVTFAELYGKGDKPPVL